MNETVYAILLGVLLSLAIAGGWAVILPILDRLSILDGFEKVLCGLWDWMDELMDRWGL